MTDYDTARAAFIIASKEYRGAQEAYRRRLIGDAEFLAARAEYEAADKALDEAEA